MADSTLKYPPWRSGAVALICSAQRPVGAILDHLSDFLQAVASWVLGADNCCEIGRRYPC